MTAIMRKKEINFCFALKNENELIVLMIMNKCIKQQVIK